MVGQRKEMSRPANPTVWSLTEHETAYALAASGSHTSREIAEMLNAQFHNYAPVRNRQMVISRMHRTHPEISWKVVVAKRAARAPDSPARTGAERQAAYVARRATKEPSRLDTRPARPQPAPARIARPARPAPPPRPELERVSSGSAYGRLGGVNVDKLIGGDRETPSMLRLTETRNALIQCRYPVAGTGLGMMVCGEPVEPGKPYCPSCCAIAYTGYGRDGREPRIVNTRGSAILDLETAEVAGSFDGADRLPAPRSDSHGFDDPEAQAA